MKAVIRYEDSKGGLHKTEEEAKASEDRIKKEEALELFRRRVHSIEWPDVHLRAGDANEIPKKFFNMFLTKNLYVNLGYYKYLMAQVKKLYMLGKEHGLTD